MVKKAVAPLIGAHTSAAGGVHNALLEGRKIGATTIQLFTSNQRQWNSRTLTEEEISLWDQCLKETGLTKIMSHASYLINLGAADSEVLTKSRKAFREELKRCHQLHIDFLNFHPGAATVRTREECLDTIIESLLDMRALANEGPTRLLLEATAGQGSTIGATFEELASIIQGVEKEIPIGVCIDTCHIFAAGYDIRTEESWNHVLEQFDSIVGLQHLYALHLNDSLQPFNSHRDRHALLGEGEIGIDCFKVVMQDARLKDLPKYLETPDPAKWPEEISLLHHFFEGATL